MALNRYDFEVNGFAVPAVFESAAVDGIFRPLVERLFEMKARRAGRSVAFLAGPPGSGKSTLALMIERLSGESGRGRIQALSMDGFHYPEAYIASHAVLRDGVSVPMARVKGSPESYDAARLEAAVRALRGERVRWPAYDRRLHDVVEDAVEVTGDIALVEGNWLLLNEAGFSRLRGLCEYSVVLHADEALLMDRLISRKRMGGSTLQEAMDHCAFCDRPNIQRYEMGLTRGDLNLRITGDGRYEVELPS